MEILNRLDNLLGYISIISLVISFFVMKRIKSKANTNNNQEHLNSFSQR
jgi:hypothetical protein